jgi:2-hydroxychromene-2-carboxylate isomerase
VAVRDALFERGQDISDPDVLEHIADSYGLGPVMPSDDAQVDTDWEDGRRRDVVGSPHFFLGDDGVFCPTLDITKVDGRLHIAIDQPAFDAFVEQVFT